MLNKFRPLLAVQAEISDVKYPVYASPKLDGLRTTIFQGVAYSRSLKPLPNKEIQAFVASNWRLLEGMDGEFIVGEPTDPDVFNKSTSFVMSRDKTGEPFCFHVFDLVKTDMAFSERYKALQAIFFYPFRYIPRQVQLVPQTLIRTEEELIRYEELNLKLGYEGTMLRKPSGEYKFGRSTLKSGVLLKRKTFLDMEAEVLGYEPKMHNTNEATTNELGYTERSSHKEGLVALDMLGSLTCRTKEGKVFSCGSGFTEEQRIQLWKEKDTLVGKLAKVKYFPIGMQDGVPRFPIWLGFRSELDIS